MFCGLFVNKKKLASLYAELEQAQARANSIKASLNALHARRPRFGQYQISNMRAAARNANNQGAGVNMAKINNMQRQLNNHSGETNRVMGNWRVALTKVANIEKNIRQTKGQCEPKPVSYGTRFYG